MSLISRKAALEKVRAMQTYKLSEDDDMLLVDKAEVQTELMMLPSAQPMRKKGKWIYDSPVTMKCDQCEYVVRNLFAKHFRYCPSCSADMRERRPQCIT